MIRESGWPPSLAWMFAAFMLLAGAVSIASAQTGQRFPDSTRIGPCGCFCGGKTPDYVVFGEKHCAGILAADACGNHMSSLPNEQREETCKKIKANGRMTTCPVLASSCEREGKPPSSKTSSTGSGRNQGSSGNDCRTVADAAADKVKKDGGTEKEQQAAYERAKYNCMERD